MDKTNEYRPVNWINGMKINKNHFIAQQQAAVYQQALGNAIFLNEHNYGLLPITGKITAPKIWLSVDNMQQVNVRVMSCKAVTPGGYLMIFDHASLDDNNPLSAKIPGLSVPFHLLKDKHDFYYVVLAVDPYNTVPYGAADPEEQPVRLPFTQPTVAVSLIPEAETNLNTLGNFQLPIGKVEVKDQNVSLVEDYLPPCTTVNSHQVLIQHHAEMEQFFGRMELNTLQILQKILQKSQQNELIEPIRRVCEHTLFYISGVYSGYRLTGRFQQPVDLFTPVSGLGRVLKNAIDVFTGTAKEEMINYFMEWCNVKQGELEDEISDICNYKYDHLNIHTGLEKSARFSALILQLFTNLAALDYIGKKKETGIFVKERLIVPEEEIQAKRRGFFLAD